MRDRHAEHAPDRTPDASPDQQTSVDATPPWDEAEYPNVVEFIIARRYGVETDGDRSPSERPPPLEKVDARFPDLYDRSACAPPREIDRHQPAEHWVADRNPGYLDIPGRDNNCGDCARASEVTWRGTDTQAGALTDPAIDGEPKVVMDTWSPGDRVPTDFDEIKARLEALGHGSSAIVGVDWKSGGGHWFNAVNDNGVITASDGQTGRSEAWPPTSDGLGFDETRCKNVDTIIIDPDGKHLRYGDWRER
jgi:hypothetical protein